MELTTVSSTSVAFKTAISASADFDSASVFNSASASASDFTRASDINPTSPDLIRADDYTESTGTRSFFFGLFFWPLWLVFIVPVFLPAFLFLALTVVGSPAALSALAHLCYGFYGDRLFSRARPTTHGLHWFPAGLFWCSYVCAGGPVALLLLLLYTSFLWVVLEFCVFLALVLVPALIVVPVAACVLGPHGATAALGQGLRQSTDFILRVVFWTLFPMWDVRANVVRSEARWRRSLAHSLISAKRSTTRTVLFWASAGLLFTALELVLPMVGFVTDLLFFEEARSAWYDSEYTDDALFTLDPYNPATTVATTSTSFELAYGLALFSFAVSTVCHILLFARLAYLAVRLHRKRLAISALVVAGSGLDSLSDAPPVPPEATAGATTRTVQFLKITLGDLVQLIAVFVFLLAVNGVSSIARLKLVVSSVSIALALALFLFRAKFGRVTNRLVWQGVVFVLCLVHGLLVPVVLNVAINLISPVVKEGCSGAATTWYPNATASVQQHPADYDVTMCASFSGTAALNLTVPYPWPCSAQAAVLNARATYCYNPALLPVLPSVKCLAQTNVVFRYVAHLSSLVVADDCVLQVLYFSHLLTVDDVTVQANPLLHTLAFGPLQRLGTLTVVGAPSLTRVLCLGRLYATNATRVLVLDADAQARYSAGNLTISC